MPTSNRTLGPPTRLPGGLTNCYAEEIFKNLRIFDPTKHHVYFEDFDYYTASNWTVTETQAGATQALTDGDGGLILLTNSAADNDVNQLQKVGESFLMESGKELFLKARFSLADVTQSDFAIGLQVANTDGTSLASAVDGIFFLKADGAATIDAYVRQADVAANSVNETVTTLVNATMVELAMYYNGKSTVYAAVNGVLAATLDVTSSIIPNTELAPIISLKNGEAVAKTATIDYLLVAKPR